MRKYELIEDLQEKLAKNGTVVSKNKLHRIYNELTKMLAERLIASGSINIQDIGTLRIKDRKACNRYNPSTGKTMMLRACKRIKFTPTKVMKWEVFKLSSEPDGSSPQIPATETV